MLYEVITVHELPLVLVDALDLDVEEARRRHADAVGALDDLGELGVAQASYNFV